LLSKHTTFKIGGRAKFFLEPKNLEELALAIKEAKHLNIPIYILGAGSNLLVNDKGVEGLVIKLSKPFFKKIKFFKDGAQVGAGVKISTFIREAERNKRTGIEFLAGIPGTLGGAIAMNAGIPGFCIGDLVQWVKVIDQRGLLKKIPQEKIKFVYRTSHLDKCVIVCAKIKLTYAKQKEIRRLLKAYLAKRYRTQDYSAPSAGCIFKNPKGESSGRLIELCGLKGKRIGDAEVSLRHANFILNRKKATAKDVLKLMYIIKEKVKSKFGIVLEPEIKIW